MADSSVFQGIASRIGNLRANPRLRVAVLITAAVGFLVGFIATISSVSVEWSRLAWPALAVLLLVAVPAMTSSNALEYTVAARLAGRSVRALDALRIAVLSTAANLLPLPGGPFVRMRGLIDEGVRGASAAAVTTLMALAWLSAAILTAGVFGGLSPWPAAAAMALGGAGIALVLWFLRRRLHANGWPRLAGAVIATELVATLVTAARFWLAARALGLSIGGGAFVLGVAPVLGAIAIVVPAGLGVREAIAALVAPAVGLDPAEGFLIASLDRLAGLLFHGAAAVALAAVGRRDGAQEVR